VLVMQSEKYIEQLRLLFQQEDGNGIITLFERTNESLLKELNTEQADEVDLVMALAYYRTNNLRKAKHFSNKVIENLVRENLIDEASEVFREMVLIGLRARLKQNKYFQAYGYILKKKKLGLNIEDSPDFPLEEIVSEVINKMLNSFYLTYYLVNAIIIVVQWLISPFDKGNYIVFICLNLVFLICHRWIYPRLFSSLIKFIYS
jgi:pentatricopeptide repeat protein